MSHAILAIAGACVAAAVCLLTPGRSLRARFAIFILLGLGIGLWIIGAELAQ